MLSQSVVQEVLDNEVALEKLLGSVAFPPLDSLTANIPSMELRVGDVVGWTARGKRSKFFAMAKEWQGGREVPGWLRVDPATLEGAVTALPARQDLDVRIDENAIIEYYSR